MNSVNDLKQTFATQYPNLFRDFGTFEGEYHIQLREDAKPFALTALRRVTVPLLSKVEAELKRMEGLGVISPVNEPTDWCAGMGVVLRSYGKVKICINVTKLNESVQR